MGNSKRLPFQSYKCRWNYDKTETPIWCYQHQGWLVKCEQCGTMVHSARQTTKTCSDKCRTAKSRAHRLHNASKKTPQRLISALEGESDEKRKEAVSNSRWFTEIRTWE